MSNTKPITLNDLRSKGTQKRKRVARGNAGKGGTYAGRGRKGQSARSGGGKGPYFEGGQLPLVRRLPRVRGFTNIFRVPYRIVNLKRLDEVFAPGDEINPETLLQKGLIKKGKTAVKVLGQGELSKPLTIQAHAFSAGARSKIEAAGGSAIEISAE